MQTGTIVWRQCGCAAAVSSCRHADGQGWRRAAVGSAEPTLEAPPLGKSYSLRQGSALLAAAGQGRPSWRRALARHLAWATARRRSSQRGLGVCRVLDSLLSAALLYGGAAARGGMGWLAGGPGAALLGGAEEQKIPPKWRVRWPGRRPRQPQRGADAATPCHAMAPHPCFTCSNSADAQPLEPPPTLTTAPPPPTRHEYSYRCGHEGVLSFHPHHKTPTHHPTRRRGREGEPAGGAGREGALPAAARHAREHRGHRGRHQQSQDHLPPGVCGCEERLIIHELRRCGECKGVGHRETPAKSDHLPPGGCGCGGECYHFTSLHSRGELRGRD